MKERRLLYGVYMYMDFTVTIRISLLLTQDDTAIFQRRCFGRRAEAKTFAVSLDLVHWSCLSSVICSYKFEGGLHTHTARAVTDCEWAMEWSFSVSKIKFIVIKAIMLMKVDVRTLLCRVIYNIRYTMV